MNEPTKPLRIPPEDPDKVRTRDQADLDRNFESTPGTDPVEYLGETDE